MFLVTIEMIENSAPFDLSNFFTAYTRYMNCWTFRVYAASAFPMGVHPLQPPFHFSLMVNIGSLVAGNLSMIFLMWMMMIAASVTAALW